MRRFGTSLLTLLGGLTALVALLTAIVVGVAFLATVYKHFAWEQEPPINWQALAYLVICLCLAALMAAIIPDKDDEAEPEEKPDPATGWLPPR